MDFYEAAGSDQPVRASLGLVDRFYLLTILNNRVDAVHPWIYERCRELEAEPDGYLDLWAREHYKSTLITFAGVEQEYLIDPDITVGIFSHTRPIAKAFLRQHKQEMENNALLKATYPDVLWEEPGSEAPWWSEDNGIVVKRPSNKREATVEAWGLVDGQPTGKHFDLIVYDDVVTLGSVTTPDMIAKVTAAWEMSRNLAAEER